MSESYKKKLLTKYQLLALVKAGYKKDEVSQLTVNDAERLITCCKKNDWQRPQEAIAQLLNTRT